MKTTIVYIHGWGSSPQGATAVDLKNHFSEENFISPHIDYTRDPDLIKKQMDSLGKILMKKDAVVIGSSAGGFWADYIGSIYGIKTVLINPSLRPATNFIKYNLPDNYYTKYSKLQNDIKDHARHHIVAFAGEKDDIVPLSHIQTHYKNPIMLKGEGHRLKDLSPIIEMIKSMIGNFPEHQ